MQLIPNYALYGYSNDGNVVTAVRSDSSVSKRLDATYRRKQPTYNPNTEVFSIPEAGVAIRRDILNLDGKPTGQRAVADLTFRLPTALSSGDLDDLITDIRAYVNDVQLKDNLLKLMLPTCCAEEPEE